MRNETRGEKDAPPHSSAQASKGASRTAVTRPSNQVANRILPLESAIGKNTLLQSKSHFKHRRAESRKGTYLSSEQ
ncbi:hypothetical protein NDU88_005504 [Pleurodeles waltl]|uniref:Uncharacterized protein n=1 Tax=Pleurodeles waltl TaxID=8319 RepID=A0AAV7LN24_PLEWA|nr:hypothetical protein NDU88_005504 [Pleurodeles waltl]